MEVIEAMENKIVGCLDLGCVSPYEIAEELLALCEPLIRAEVAQEIRDRLGFYCSHKQLGHTPPQIVFIISEPEWQDFWKQYGVK